MQLLLVPVLLHLCLVPVKAPLELADEGMVPHVGLLLLLPLHGMLLDFVVVHLFGVDAAPPDVKLVFTQLALQAPLLSVGTTNVVLDLILTIGGPGAVLPSAGVADVVVDTFNVLLPVISSAKTLPTLITFECSDLLMHSLDVHS